uniref:Reverse transcriptase domain-containing protein n=1 Tax=Anabas testudineus TaxID=64144 RepID=A0AAQ6IJQ8_ANATE
MLKRWTEESKLELQGCFDCTVWEVFEAAARDIHELTDTVTSYISFCEDMCISTKTVHTFNNNKPWFTPNLRKLRQAKEEAYRSGDRSLYRQARNRLTKEIKAAKRSYGEKLQNNLSLNDPASVWRGLQHITNYRKPSPHPEASKHLADDLNNFYCRFEKNHLTPPGHTIGLPASPNIHTLPSSDPLPALKICEEDVCSILQRQKIRKATGPDGLKVCAGQLVPIFTQIFNRSLQLFTGPNCFRQSTIVPLPKKSTITSLNDYRPVALTSVVMKSFERLVMNHLKDITDPLLDPLQFAYRKNRSADDAVNLGLHYILQHLDLSGTYVRILFVDFSSAFNTITPGIFDHKLTQLTVPAKWIRSFLTDRRQQVRLGGITSGTRTISTGAPQGCVLSPLLFSLYTNDCTSGDPSVKLLKYADDMTVIGLIRDGDESAYRQEVEQLVQWCSQNQLELNTLKTVEMTVDFRKNRLAPLPLTIHNTTVSIVDSFRFLGSTISQDMKWSSHIETVHKKSHQRLYFLRQLRKFNLPQELLTMFYTAIIQSVLCTSITVWFGSATKQDRHRLQRVIRSADKIIGTELPSIQHLYRSRLRKWAVSITADPTHPAHKLFKLLPSGRRHRAIATRTTRHRVSFFPQAVSELNCPIP